MPCAMFHGRFPEIAARETRTIILSERISGLPPSDYCLLEMYCDEPGCDCRRVLISVFVAASQSIEAVLAYGWESRDFYVRWMHEDDPLVIHALQGPALNLASPQSPRAAAILELVEKVALPDKQYIERLKNHYRMFRETIDVKAGARGRRQKKKRPR